MPIFPPPEPVKKGSVSYADHFVVKVDEGAPPEFPRVDWASVWRKSSKLCPSLSPVLRPFAEIIPDVTVWPMPSGFPIAQHHVADADRL